MSKVRAYSPVLQFFNDDGSPMVGGHLETYKAGTSIPVTTYADESGTLNPVSIPLDSRGECTVYLTAGIKYKFVLKNKFGGVAWTADNYCINEGGEGGGGGGGTDIEVSYDDESKALVFSNEFEVDDPQETNEVEKIVDGAGLEFALRDNTKESLANKVTSVRNTDEATDTNYPSEHAVSVGFAALAAAISTLWTNAVAAFQTIANKVTSIRAVSSASDDKYPSEKAVAAALESKAPSAVTSEVAIANGDKIIIADASDSSKLKRASAAFDGSTTKNFLNQKGTFTQVLEADIEWGGDFRTSKPPSEAYTRQNLWFNPKSSAVYVEYCTDRTSANPTWLPYGETDTDKLKLFSGAEDTAAAFYCGKNTHIQPGYTGSISGTKDLTNEIVPDQGLRITICCRSLASRDADVDNWSYGQIVRVLMNVNTNSATGGTRHCLVETMTGANFKADNDTWVNCGDFNISGDSGWNSIPLQVTFGGGWTQTSHVWVVRFTLWAEALNANPASSQTGNLKINTIAALTKTTWSHDAMQRYGTPYSITETGGAVFKDIKFTARKLKTNLARTADSTFDGSADQLNIPVTGTLPVGNGGTGKTTAKAAEYNLTTGKSEISDTTSGDDRVVFELASPSEINGVTRGFRKLSTIWTWIASQISSVLGLSTTGYTGNAATATTAQNYDTSTGTIQSALALKSDTGHVHNTDANEVTDSAVAADLDVVTDTTEIVTTNTNGYTSNDKKLYRRPAGTKLWPWIKSKIDSYTGVVHTTGSETINGTKTFSNTTQGIDYDVNVQSVTNSGTHKISVGIGLSGNRGLWDYGGSGSDFAGENKWIIYKDPDNVVHVGDASAEPNTIRLGKLTIDSSGTIGVVSNTLYIG